MWMCILDFHGFKKAISMLELTPRIVIPLARPATFDAEPETGYYTEFGKWVFQLKDEWDDKKIAYYEFEREEKYPVSEGT